MVTLASSISDVTVWTTENARVVIYDRKMFIIQGFTGHRCNKIEHFTIILKCLQ
jgi:hypothetical protein